MVPLVCLHGSLCDSTYFDGLKDELPGYTVLCIDLPGHGDSAHTFKGPSPLEAMAADVRHLIARMGVTRRPWAIAGHSLGGAVALLTIHTIATAPEDDERLPVFFLSLEGNATPSCCAPDGLARRVATMPNAPSDEAMLHMLSSSPYWEASARKLGDGVGLLAHGIWVSLVEWCDGRRDGNTTLETMLRHVPWRFLYGTESGKFHSANRAAVGAHFDAEAAGVDGAGHFMLIDRPAQSLAAIKSLLQQFTPQTLGRKGQQSHRSRSKRRRNDE